MKKFLFTLSCLVIIGYAKINAQTTLNLADQCNCEIFKSDTEVTAGATAPAGADTGDLLVDPSGDIFFWDGDSWELSSDMTIEPWFGTDDDAPATLNTEDIYQLGRVGIGTPDPDARLNVVTTDGEQVLRAKRDVDGSARWSLENDVNIMQTTVSPGEVTQIATANGDPGWISRYFFSTKNLVFASPIAPATSQINNIGIGTGATVNAKLEVNGDVRVRLLAPGASTDGIVVADADGTLFQRTLADVFTDGLDGGNNASDNHLGDFNQTLAANRTVNMNDNNLTFSGVGTNGDADQVQFTRLPLIFTGVDGTDASVIYGVQGGLALDAQNYAFQEVAGGTSITRVPALFLQNNTDHVGIRTTSPDRQLTVVGGASKSAGGNTWDIFSDRRLKEDIQPYADGLEQLLQIEPVTFKYNGKGPYEASGKTEVGIIAQDLQKIAPYILIKDSYSKKE